MTTNTNTNTLEERRRRAAALRRENAQLRRVLAALVFSTHESQYRAAREDAMRLLMPRFADREEEGGK